MDLHNMERNEACQKVYSKLGEFVTQELGTSCTFITGTGPLQKQVADIIEEHGLVWEIPASNLGIIKAIS